MFSFFKKKTSNKVDLSEIGVDMHSHLAPGIDDGSDSVESSVSYVQGLMDLGFRKFIMTPHIISDMYRNNAETISAAHGSLANGLTQGGIEVPTSYAAEYYMDEYFEGLLESDVPLLTLKDKMVLVEVSFSSAPINFKQMLFSLQMKGYQPVLAHPERYLYLANNKGFYDELKNMGVLFQMNLLSVANHYGKTASDLAHYLIKKGYIDLVGTDLHHGRHLEVLRTSPNIMGPVKTLLDTGRILNAGL
ncbi:MAG: histidinol phosphatase [Chitinophagaceae bacterium]|nr:MAG: histidinol phosphatase [Chitinophagaceae bacterium]